MKKTLMRLGLGILLGAAALAQPAFPQPSAAYDVEGTVKDKNGNPLEGVTVSFRGMGGELAPETTDTNGHYVKASLVPGPYVVTASAYGYIEERKDIEISNRNMRCDFIMREARFVISGVVAAADGSSIPGVAIEVRGPRWIRTATGDDGTFRLDDCPSGQYAITAFKDGYIRQSDTVKIKDEDVKYDFMMQAQSFTISGMVTGTDGMPVSMAQIDISGPSGSHVITGSSGRYYATGIISGTYSVIASKMGYFIGQKTVTISESDVTCDLILNIQRK